MNNEQLLKLKNLKLARVRYFDAEHNGAEVTSLDAYAFLYEREGEYVNVFNPERELPVYGRVPYTNTTLDGEDYGTKIVLKSGEVETGPCYIIDEENCDRFFGKDQMKFIDLKQYVIRSEKFFIDRLEMMQELGTKERIINYKKIREDMRKYEEFDRYMASHDKTISFGK